MKHTYIMLSVFILALSLQINASNEFVVIVNNSNKSTTITKDKLRKIYHGKELFFENNVAIVPLLQENESKNSRFLEQVIGEQMLKFKKYWIKRSLSAQGTPPKQCKTDLEVLEIVKSNTGAIGFVEKSLTNSSVKIIALTETN